MTRQGKVLAAVALLLAVAIVAPHTTPFLLLLFTRVLVLAILAMSLDLLLGFTGLASLGQAAYLGLGAYLTAILAIRCQFGLGWDFSLVIVLAILLGAATAAFFGLFAVRAGGVYFLMITLALSQCVWGLAYRWDSLTGGDNGLNLPGRPVLGAIRLGNDMNYFYLVFGFFVVSLLLLYVLVESPFGRSLVGIREHEVRMRILGYNTWLHKYIAFIVAGGFGGLAGVLWAEVNGQVSPEDVSLTTAVDALLMVVLGGPGTLIGAVVAVRLGRGIRADDLLSAGRRKVEKKKMFGYPNAELWNVVIKTYPLVSQFWKYGKAVFLEQPVYGRDYPPCKYCE